MDRDNPATFGAERDANARLMALAPAMLEALERIARANPADIREMMEMVDLADHAIR
jgi:hypothetical protein